jgi:hypothetical protein
VATRRPDARKESRPCTPIHIVLFDSLQENLANTLPPAHRARSNLPEIRTHDFIQTDFHAFPLGSEGDIDDTNDEMTALDDPLKEQAKDLLLANAARRPGASGSDEDIHKVLLSSKRYYVGKTTRDVVNSGFPVDRGANGDNAGANVEIV